MSNWCNPNPCPPVPGKNTGSGKRTKSKSKHSKHSKHSKSC